MDPCVAIPLDDGVLEDLISKAKDWALTHGICMRTLPIPNPDTMAFAPFVLLPSRFPRKEFFKAKSIQKDINEVLHWAAHDDHFLKDCLKSTIQVDEFTASLFKIYETVEKEGVAQPVSLGIFRSDYLLNLEYSADADYTVKQVEINSIASSFGALSSHIYKLHRYILQELGLYNCENYVPENHALQGISDGIISAWEIYNQPHAVVLFLVENVTINICDQRMLEFEIRQRNNKVKVIRRTFLDINNRAKLQDKVLIIDGLEVAVIYFRTGYVPGDFRSQNDWDSYLKMERSKAIKCPSIHYHLVGTKKVQQILAQTGMLERFLNDKKKAAALREVFTGLYSLDFNPEGESAIEKAIHNPRKFVLKPQREGGGNNLYNEDVQVFLQKFRTSNERTAYILMDRINPPTLINYMIRPNNPPELCETISELGVFGVLIGDKNDIHKNQEVGHLMRTKKASANEGGVSAGFGALDSLYLSSS